MPDASQLRAHGRVGTTIGGKYRIDAFIASGTMANVYAATHRNGARVALKILHRELAGDPALRERFKREGYFANTIGHAGVIRAIDDDFTEDGCAYIVMELLEGETLEERRVRLGGKVPLRQAIDAIDHVLDVLAAAHARDVLHRDIKPDNVFITRTGDVKVLDFGVARFNDGKSSSDMTQAGMVVGTPAFMPPEQALGRREEVDARSDLWGVGATLFVALTGQAVHPGNDAKLRLIATARTPARPIREVAPEVPRAVASVVDRALAFDRADRWEDATAMREALRWARRAIDGDHELPPRRAVDEPSPSTRKPEPLETDDEVTLTGRTDSRPPGHGRAPSGPDSLIRGSAATIPASESVFTSAPPITLRDPGGLRAPASVAVSEPVFSLRREKPLEAMPETERSLIDDARSGGVVSGSEVLSSGDAPRVTKPMAVVYAAPEIARPNEPSAPGDPPPNAFTDLAHAASTLPLDGAERDAAAQAAFAATVAAMPVVTPPPEHQWSNAPPPTPHLPALNTPSLTSQGPHFPGISYSAAPYAAEMPSPPRAFGSAPPPPYDADIAYAEPAHRMSAPPGPALQQIIVARKRGQGVRIFLTLLVGLAAAGATFAFVMRHRLASAGPAPVASAATSASASVPAPPASSAASAAPPASAAPIASAAVSVAKNDAPPPPKKKRRRRPPPAATAAGTTSASAAPAATTAEPADTAPATPSPAPSAPESTDEGP